MNSIGLFIFATVVAFAVPSLAHASGYVTTENTGVPRVLQAGDRILVNVDIDQRVYVVSVSTISAIVNTDGTLSNAYITRSLPCLGYEIVPYLDGGTVTADGLIVYAALGAQLYKGGTDLLTVSEGQINLISQLESHSYIGSRGNAWLEFGGLSLGNPPIFNGVRL